MVFRKKDPQGHKRYKHVFWKKTQLHVVSFFKEKTWSEPQLPESYKYILKNKREKHENQPL